jgi:hypothetical protein
MKYLSLLKKASAIPRLECFLVRLINSRKTASTNYYLVFNSILQLERCLLQQVELEQELLEK